MQKKGPMSYRAFVFELRIRPFVLYHKPEAGGGASGSENGKPAAF